MILIIDTTSSEIKVLLRDGLVTKVLEVESSQQAVDLPRMVMETTGGDFSKIDAVGVIVGPGSFTGIRLGIAFAKGLSMGLGVPVVGVSIFDLFSEPALAIASGRGDFFVKRAEEFSIEKDIPDNVRIITDYDLEDAVEIVQLRKNMDVPVIPLYIRPSYVEMAAKIN